MRLPLAGEQAGHAGGAIKTRCCENQRSRNIAKGGICRLFKNAGRVPISCGGTHYESAGCRILPSAGCVMRNRIDIGGWILTGLKCCSTVFPSCSCVPLNEPEAASRAGRIDRSPVLGMLVDGPLRGSDRFLRTLIGHRPDGMSAPERRDLDQETAARLLDDHWSVRRIFELVCHVRGPNLFQTNSCRVLTFQ
ncbi:hypothetical protein ACVIM8_001965 [Bradyrhizobium sp. USDA 4529]